MQGVIDVAVKYAYNSVDAFSRIFKKINGNYRIFGYNAPDTDASAEEYGYEVCVTIPDDMEVADEKVKTKVIQGGQYAVISIEPKDKLGEEIMRGWQRFSKWLEGSKYIFGDAQWLEEHLGFGDNFEQIGKPDFFYKLFIKIPEGMEITDDKIAKEIFPGGISD